MALQMRAAAQYIRMSTDKQELSPLIQKEAIAAYAARNGFEIVASYEDEGRSGVYLKNRPGLGRLLRDVTDSPVFGTILVYDVSRWGRFQDADASAYYEYHCRLHGVGVTYVAEAFGSDATPMGTLVKNMKRVMAAEFSRELATKSRAGQHRVVNLGYHMGPLPSLGYRRCSVSADGRRRTLLEPGQRKLTQTDRIVWVPGPDKELGLVRRMCREYASGRLSFADLEKLGQAEGWTNMHGGALSRRAIANVIRSEALIGNFVWGRKCRRQRILEAQLCRATGTVPRIIDDQTWHRIQQRLAREAGIRSDEVMRDDLRRALARSPSLATRDLAAAGCASSRSYRERFGDWASAVVQAGGNPAVLCASVEQRANARRKHLRDFGCAIAEGLRAKGLPAAYVTRHHLLCLRKTTLRLQLLWPSEADGPERQWRIRPPKGGAANGWWLMVRMREPYRALDYFIVAPGELATRCPPWLGLEVPLELVRFWLRSPTALMDRLRQLNA